MRSERDKLYSSKLKRGTVKIEVNFDPLLLSVLGYFNPLKPEDKPDLEKVKKLRQYLINNGVDL